MHSTRYKMNIMQSSRAIYVFWILCIQISVLFFSSSFITGKIWFEQKLYNNAHHIYKTFAMSPRDNNTKTEMFYICDTEKLIKSFYDWTWNDAKESFCASATSLKYHLNATTFYDTFFLFSNIVIITAVYTHKAVNYGRRRPMWGRNVSHQKIYTSS